MLNYRLEGKGTPLLLIHGWGVTFTIWKELAPCLSPYFQLVMVELPGFGQSPLPDTRQSYYELCIEPLEQLRKHLGFQKWAVLSYSIGTRVGEAYFQQVPSSVSKAIFLCPLVPYFAHVPSLGTLLLLDRLSSGFGDWILSDWRISFLIRFLAFNGHPHPYIQDWKFNITSQPMKNLKRMLRELPRYGRVPFKVPFERSVFIWGKKDRLVEFPRKARLFDTYIPTAHGAPMLAAPQIAEVVIHSLIG